MTITYRLFFLREHIAKTGNLGEKRESLNILDKVGKNKGLLEKLSTESVRG